MQGSVFVLHISQITLWAAIAFVCGTAQVPPAFMVGAVVVLIAYYRVGVVSRVSFGIGVLALFWMGHMHYLQHIPADAASIPYETSVQLTGTVARPPVVKSITQKIYLDTPDVPGNVYIKTGRYPTYAYGDVVAVRCTLTQPEPFDTFAFDKYLARYNIFTICRQAQLSLLDDRQGHPMMHSLYDIRAWFRTHIRTLWPEPVASLMLGVILGIQDDIPDDIVEQFRITGTIHVLVVSGMHVVIIAQMLTRSLHMVNSRIRFMIIGGVLCGFCVITGLQASVIRAAIMGMLPLLAELSRRQATMHISLPVVAAAMAIINPYVVLHDMGFQLSFLATIGLVYFQPLCDKACWWVPRQFTLRETLSTTVAATLHTTPLIIGTFGTFSVVSLAANIVVVPISTIMLFGGTAAIVLQQIVPQLALYAAYVLHVLVSWMLQVITLMSGWEHALLEGLEAPDSVVILAYGLIVGYIVHAIWRARYIEPYVG